MKSLSLSVIVPIYNVEPYLQECLDSLLAQTAEDVEYLLINDGSTDASGSMAEAFAQAHPEQFRYFGKQNGGLSDARNYGLERVRGEYVGFVDSDDFLHPSMFELMLDKARENDADVVVCRINIVAGKNTRHMVFNHLASFGNSVSEDPRVLLASRSYACNKIFRTAIFRDNDIRFPVGKAYEDSAIIYNTLYYANRIDFVNSPLYHYRFLRQGSITAAVDERMFDIFHSCDCIVEFYRSKNIESPRLPEVIETLCRNHILYRFNTMLQGEYSPQYMRFFKRAHQYLDTNFPGWRRRYKPKLKRSTMNFVRKWSWAMWLYLHIPSSLRHTLHRYKSKLRGYVNKKRKTRAATAVKRAKSQALRRVGYSLFERVGDAFGPLGLTYFADFGTLLGFIREGGFMSHDLDLDIGVIANDTPISAIREALSQAGFRLWRSYLYDGMPVEDSFYFVTENNVQLKFDVNYYQVTKEHSKVWLFYWLRGYPYATKYERHIVEMTYSPIEGTTTLRLKGHDIPIPLNAQTLLEEKYGPGWRKKDKNWIYWESPAATKLNRIGIFEEYEV